MIKLLINGIGGQMGRVITGLAKAHPDVFTVLYGVDQSGVCEVLGVPVYKSLNDVPDGADMVIDFSVAAALPEVLLYCQNKGVRLVVGTTGLTPADRNLMQRASSKVAIFNSGNMSLGVNLQIELVQKATTALGDGFDVEIIEQHHKRKIDSPSGTALMLADAVSSQFPKEMEYVHGRHSKNHRRTQNEIGIHSVRGGTIVGEHKVMFIGQDEVVEISHKAYSKQVFATGALRATQYLINKQPGLYNMHDIVTERDVLSHMYTDDKQAIITLSPLPHEAGTMAAIFDVIAEANVFVDMISMAAPGGKYGDISFSLPQQQLVTALNALKPLQKRFMGMDVHAMQNITKLTVEGSGMALRHGVAAQFFHVLSKAGVSIELVTTSETKIACCLNCADVPMAVSALAKEFAL